jgi:3-methylcrotonyl-CoA carboxylase beta subunit
LARIESTVDTGAKEFASNAAQWVALRDDLVARRAAAALGGTEKSRERHTARGK